MFKAIASPHLVPFDGSFREKAARTAPVKATDKDESKKRLKKLVEELGEMQELLYASDQYAVLLIFQALDAAGKDSTIGKVLTGINPLGCQVFSFKAPNAEELDHDFLWRTTRCLPERGRIGVFSRSHYEEVLVVRVHPEYLKAQKLPHKTDPEKLWQERFESIREYELHLVRNGVVILKFWLNVSEDEQRRRFLSRLDEPHKSWKFNPRDVYERRFRNAYLEAYEEALNATSKPWAPWYAIPADDKDYMRETVAEIIVDNLKRLALAYPTPSAEDRAKFAEQRKVLEAE
ncbi:MAG: polyphosphate kinase 2 family protein [Burkholderiales bacterium]|nr:polyphosphate kinase 2 family protein [Burkholderiales bacterium]